MLLVDNVWLDAPLAALQLWREGDRVCWRLNRAAIEWSLVRRVSEAQWAAFADEAEAAARSALEGRATLGRDELAWRAVPQAERWLLWLAPTGPLAGLSVPAMATAPLTLVPGFGRIGFFECPAAGRGGWWDRYLFRLFGLEPSLDPPAFDELLQRVHPDDRERLRLQRDQALGHPGAHEIRFRLRLPDGRQRDAHALVESRIDAQGRVIGLAGVVIDDTEGASRVREQQALSAHLQRALSLAQVSVWRTDLQSQRIHLNDNGHAFSGLAPRADGVPIDELRARVHPDDQPALQRAAELAMARDSIVDVEARYRAGDGGWRHLLTRRVAERDEHGRVVALAGVSLDQTERIAERERAQALARRIQLVADAAGVGVWSIDSTLDGGDERVEWNDHMFRIYGLDARSGAPPTRQWMGELVDALDRPRLAEERRRARQAGAAGFQIEFRVVRPDGERRWVVCRNHREVRGDRVVQHGIHLDVTQQRATDLELRLQQQWLTLAAESAGVGIWERDLTTNEVRWNEQMYRLRGLPVDDPRAARQIDEQLLEPEALAERGRRIRRHLEDGRPYAFEFAVHRPDGSVCWLASTGRAVRDERGVPVRMVGLNWDVTERRRAEAALRDMEAAERASRAKSEFLARMSHELRTPLNAILGFAQLLQHDAAARLDAVQRERLAHIRSAGAHLLALIDDVLDLSAVESGSMHLVLQPTAIDDAVGEVRRWLEPMAAAQGVVLHVMPSGGRVQADARRLTQVLANLMTNAVKYNRRGGAVWLGAHPAGVDGVDGWTIAVRDDGRGMSESQLARLFEPFDRLGAEREGIEGRGIGLATAHHLVQHMGGRIHVRSAPGAGSEFSVWLPAAAPAAPPVTADAGVAAATADERPRLSVLYVEDDPVNVLLVEQLVALRPNVRLASAPDGTSGVDFALRERPDVVLVDLHLPDFGGDEVLRRLRAAGLGSRVVALTASALAEEPARLAGFDEYWTKPIDLGRFLAALDLWGDPQSSAWRPDPVMAGAERPGSAGSGPPAPT